jgi:hypothetical protein
MTLSQVVHLDSSIDPSAVTAVMAGVWAEVVAERVPLGGNRDWHSMGVDGWRWRITGRSALAQWSS